MTQKLYRRDSYAQKLPLHVPPHSAKDGMLPDRTAFFPVAATPRHGSLSVVRGGGRATPDGVTITATTVGRGGSAR